MENQAPETPLLGPGMAISASIAGYRTHLREIIILLFPPLLLLVLLDALFGTFLVELPLLRSLIVYAVNVPAGAALMHFFASRENVEGGRTLAAYADISGKLPRLYVAGVVQAVLTLPLMAFFLLGIADKGFLCAISIIAVLLYIYLTVRLMLWIPEIVVRNSRLWDAVGGSWRKTRGNFIAVFGVYFISAILAGLCVGLPVVVLQLILGEATADPAAYSVLGNILDDLTTAVILPFNIGINLVIFYSLTAGDADRPQAAAPDSAGGAGG
ncbi:MAG: glycerophosphoryl diester phosphodiesterase membrane domain-containing protein [Anaerolineales bacterium]